VATATSKFAAAAAMEEWYYMNNDMNTREYENAQEHMHIIHTIT